MRNSDRPLRRRIVKLIFTILRGRSRAHWQDSWPGLTIQSVERSITYRGKTAGQLVAASFPQGMPEINIVGSGPSVLEQDPSRLAPKTAVLLNGAVTLCARVKPLAVAVEDERFIWRHGDMLRRTLVDEEECLFLFSTQVIRALLEQDPNCLKDRRIALIDNALKPHAEDRRRADDPKLSGTLRMGEDGTALSIRPDKGIAASGTVAFSASQFALAANPAKIGFVGIDIKNADKPRFYEKPGASAASGILSGAARILAGFTLLKKVAEERHIELICYSPVSSLLDLGYHFSDALAIIPDQNFIPKGRDEVIR